MNIEQKKIIDLITNYLGNHPDQRFGQVLFNLGIIEFHKTTEERNPNYNIRDIHNDKDTEILERIERQLEWLELQRKVNEGISNTIDLRGMTVIERLIATDLLDSFYKFKLSNIGYSELILKALNVDSKLIEKTLK